MNTVTCKHCKKEVSVEFYFHGARITTHDSPYNPLEQYYKAMVNGRATCPRCGGLIEEVFYHTLNTSEIIKLAGGGIDYE